MGIAGFYENKYEKHEEHQSYQNFKKSYNISFILEKIKNNRNLKILAGIIGILIFSMALALVLFVTPLVVKTIGFVNQIDIQEVTANISSFINKIK